MIRTRGIVLVALTILMIVIKFITDPTQGAVTTEFLIYVSTPILVVLLAHWLRKFLFPYADMHELYAELKQSPVGAGLGFVGMAIIIYAIMGLFGPSVRAQDVTTYIPAQAKIYAPLLVSEQVRLWSDHPKSEPLVV